MKSWLKKLIDQLTEKRDGLVLLRLSFNRQSKLEPQTSRSNAIPVCPLCGVVPVNWTVHNKWCRFVTETKSTETVLVGTEDGAVRVPVDRVTHPKQGCFGPMQSVFEKTCGEKAPKKKDFLTYSHVSRELTPEEKRKGRHVFTKPETSRAKRQKQRTVEDTHPADAVPEIRCMNCDATKTQLATRGNVGPCCSEPFWTVPFELIWRSLPRGEDR